VVRAPAWQNPSTAKKKPKNQNQTKQEVWLKLYSAFFCKHETELKPQSHKKKIKPAGGMTQVVEHLPNKCEALSSNPNTDKKFFFENILIFFWVGLEFELRASHLQILYCLSHASSPFLLCLLWRWGLMNYLPQLCTFSTGFRTFQLSCSWLCVTLFFASCMFVSCNTHVEFKKRKRKRLF
jgi:hypothetical protein